MGRQHAASEAGHIANTNVASNAWTNMRITGLTFLLLITISVDNFGCTCDKLNQKKLFKSSDYVFIGQALNNITPDSITSLYLDSKGTGTRISFKVEKTLKGKIENKTIAIIPSSGCPMTFVLGEKYLVFGTTREQLYDSMDIYSPIVKLDSTDSRTDDEVIQYRLSQYYDDKTYETKIKEVYGLILDTNQCTCYSSTKKIFKKYMRRKRTAGNSMFALWPGDKLNFSIFIKHPDETSGQAGLVFACGRPWNKAAIHYKQKIH